VFESHLRVRDRMERGLEPEARRPGIDPRLLECLPRGAERFVVLPALVGDAGFLDQDVERRRRRREWTVRRAPGDKR
jgi:hypothetical protein